MHHSLANSLAIDHSILAEDAANMNVKVNGGYRRYVLTVTDILRGRQFDEMWD
jgi:hypothetical protein